MSTEKIWRDVDEVDGAVGGPGGDGSGGVRVAAKSSSGWHAQDSGKCEWYRWKYCISCVDSIYRRLYRMVTTVRMYGRHS